LLDWRALLETAISDGSSIVEVENALENGSAHLWLADGSAAITQVVKVMELPLAAGRLDELKSMLAEAEDEARELGCERIICTGRRGWARALPGYREITVMVKDI
jgi:hypothetical protein